MIAFARYTKRMLFFGALTMFSVGPSLSLPGLWTFGPPLVLWIITLYYSFKIERIKKNNNIQSFEEIFNFGKTSNKVFKHRVPMWVIVMIFGAGSFCLALIAVLFFRLFQ